MASLRSVSRSGELMKVMGNREGSQCGVVMSTPACSCGYCPRNRQREDASTNDDPQNGHGRNPGGILGPRTLRGRPIARPRCAVTVQYTRTYTGVPMTTNTTPNTSSDTRSDADIEASIKAKIDDAVAKAAANGEIDPEQPVAVIVGPDGSIEVRNTAVDGQDATEPGIPDPVSFPPMYTDESRESLADSYYKDHLETHWGF
jgi:hypothetical protein